jgi:hypothetical protein
MHTARMGWRLWWLCCSCCCVAKFDDIIVVISIGRVKGVPQAGFRTQMFADGQESVRVNVENPAHLCPADVAARREETSWPVRVGPG